jgi:hypothetical protein
MTRKPFQPTPLAVALQAASLLAVAGGVFGILISNVAQHRADVARVETPSKAPHLALPRGSEANSR